MSLFTKARAFLSAIVCVNVCLLVGCSGGAGAASTSTGSGSTTVTTPAVAAPVITSISPNTAVAGSTALTVTVTGQALLSTSMVQWNGIPLNTTFVSSTQLTAALPASALTTAGSASVTVVSGGTLSNAVNFTIQPAPPAPMLTALSPTSAAVNGPTFTLSVTGQNFTNSSAVQWNGVPLTTTYGSATMLTAVVPSTDLASAGTAQVTVTGNGATSNALSFAVQAPVVTTLNPTTANVGGAGFTLSITGQNFVSGSVVQWNGATLVTNYVSATMLTATVPATDLSVAATPAVTVANGSAVSNAVQFPVVVPVPKIASLSPTSIYAGSNTFTLTVTGTNFNVGSVVQFLGTTLTPSYSTSTTQLTVSVPASLVGIVGMVPVTVISPGTGNGPLTSAAASFSVNNLPSGQFLLSQVANDIAADPVRGLLYASVPSTATSNGNSIVTIDPTTGKITNTTAVGSEPDLLAVSPDGAYLYVALDGSSQVKRLLLPSMATDFVVSLGVNGFGTNTALDLAVSSNPDIWAVTSGNLGISPAAQQGVQIYNRSSAVGPSVGRYAPHGGFDLLLGTIVWGKDATVLYGANNESTGFDLYTLPVTSAGVGTIVDYPGAMPNFANRHIHFDPITGYVYGDTGNVVDPANGSPAGRFAYSGTMTTDGSLNLAFFVGTNTPLVLASYDLTKFTPQNTFTVPNVTGTPVRLVRFGPNGLAFNAVTTNYSGSTNTKTGQIFIYAGSLVK